MYNKTMIKKPNFLPFIKFEKKINIVSKYVLESKIPL